MPKAKLTIGFERAGTEDRGEMVLEGDTDFLIAVITPLCFVIGSLTTRYGVDEENAALTGRELIRASEATDEGKGFEGSIVKVTILDRS